MEGINWSKIESLYNVSVDSSVRTNVENILKSTNKKTVSVQALKTYIESLPNDTPYKKDLMTAYLSSVKFANTNTKNSSNLESVKVPIFISSFAIKLNKLLANKPDKFNELFITDFIEDLWNRAKNALISLRDFLFPDEEEVDYYVARRRRSVVIAGTILLALSYKYGLFLPNDDTHY